MHRAPRWSSHSHRTSISFKATNVYTHFHRSTHHTLSWAIFCFFRWYLYLYYTRWIFQDFVSARRHYLPLYVYQCFVKTIRQLSRQVSIFKCTVSNSSIPCETNSRKNPPISKRLHRKRRRLSRRSHSSSPFANELLKSGHLHVA